MLPTLVVGWRASALGGKEAGRFRKVAGTSNYCGWSAFAVNNLTVEVQVA